MASNMIDPYDYSFAVSRLRSFFVNRGFIEVHTQSRLSILAACEDPRTIATYNYGGQLWPLPQTGQMWLEHELLNNPQAPGFFCISTSFRNEPNPVPGRHDLIFPMFEFETRGEMDDLRALEEDLLVYLGFGSKASFVHQSYLETAAEFGVKDISGDIETKIHATHGPVFFLEGFPLYTSPFWNMRKNGDIANKIDVILHGIETIGSAERSSDPEEMRSLFYSISDGMYADILFAQFGRERVKRELEDFLALDFFPRFGGGIGLTRMMRALKLSGLVPDHASQNMAIAAE
jgi:aspartyl/asparaginyl-tRNA synthetase